MAKMGRGIEIPASLIFFSKKPAVRIIDLSLPLKNQRVKSQPFLKFDTQAKRQESILSLF